jgi:hypothetical protein
MKAREMLPLSGLEFFDNAVGRLVGRTSVDVQMVSVFGGVVCTAMSL